MQRICGGLAILTHPFPFNSFDLSGPCWTSQQAPLISVLVVHAFDPQWKVPVTLCDPFAEIKFYNLIDLVSCFVSTGLSTGPYNSRDRRADCIHKSPLCWY